MRPLTVPSNAEKKAVWDAYQNLKPTRVPLRWNINPRIILLDPALNPERFTFERYFCDPQVLMTVQARFQEYIAKTLSQTCDTVSDLPETWNFYVDNQNIHDGAYFGAPVIFEDGNCPSNVPSLTEADVDEFLARDFSKPLDNPWIKTRLAFHAELCKAAKDFTYAGRKGKVAPFSTGFDGPVTIGTILMGADIFMMLGTDTEKAILFMKKLMEAALVRNKALVEFSGTPWQKGSWGNLADDSVQLVSSAMYEELILPLHEWWYSANSATTPASKKRGIHLCGDVSRHLPLIHEKLGVISFDTGFPINHGALRKALGPDVEISGGPPVSLIQFGTPEQCYAGARDILQSGIKEGGRFLLQEGNNLPPACPLENLCAIYAACLEFGWFK